VRPHPPAELIADPLPRFTPAPELETWARQQFINELSPLYNEEHVHLQMAELGFLWTNVENSKHQRRIIGTCQLVTESGDKWSQGRALNQLRDWFGGVPDFLITLYAPVADEMDDMAFMALVEHELLHAAPKKDEFGAPQFSKLTGLPLFAMRGHDVSEFVGVVERYGSTSPELSRMVRAVNQGPALGQREIAAACGACLRLVK
jgi:hypothetical protein